MTKRFSFVFSRRPSIVIVLAALLLPIGISALSQSANIERQFRWESGGHTWTLIHRFCEASYRFFRTLPRTLDYTAYDVYVSDTRDDDELCGLVAALETLARNAGLDVWEKLNLVISFAQSIPYVSEEGEYPRYPLETLVEMKADCEDASILTAALLRQMGFGVVLLAFLEEHHMGVGVRVLPADASELTYYTWNGDVYYYLEPTSVGWKIGELPAGYASQPEIIRPRTGLASTF
ncbi:hypothetical protein KJ567_04380 [Candidatus Bipolaricaulota bacterium]|nr:hypothetical protein [Candidatus Bipolaricaulota bacterium]